MDFERNDYGYPVMWASEANPHSSTGTVDDQDAPEDERDDENEAPVSAPSDRIEAPEEFEDNEAVREPTVPPKAR